MSTRNPQNERSRQQMRGEVTGMTRKGASRAKPVRQSAASVHVVEVNSHKDYAKMTKDERKEQRRKDRAERDSIAAASNIGLSLHPKAWI